MTATPGREELTSEQPEVLPTSPGPVRRPACLRSAPCGVAAGRTRRGADHHGSARPERRLSTPQDASPRRPRSWATRRPAGARSSRRRCRVRNEIARRGRHRWAVPGRLKPAASVVDHCGVSHCGRARLPASSRRGNALPSAVRITSGVSRRGDATTAVLDLAAQLPADPGLVMFWAPAGYDLGDVSAAVNRVWSRSRVIGCTSAGGIGPAGYCPDGLVAVALSAADLRAATVTIRPLSDLPQALASARAQLQAARDRFGGRAAFAGRP
jgi:FIST N domain